MSADKEWEDPFNCLSNSDNAGDRHVAAHCKELRRRLKDLSQALSTSDQKHGVLAQIEIDSMLSKRPQDYEVKE